MSNHVHEWYFYVVQSGRPVPHRRCDRCGIVEWLWDALDGDGQWHRAPTSFGSLVGREVPSAASSKTPDR